MSAPAAFAFTVAASSSRSSLRSGTAFTSQAASLPSNGKLQCMIELMSLRYLTCMLTFYCCLHALLSFLSQKQAPPRRFRATVKGFSLCACIAFTFALNHQVFCPPILKQNWVLFDADGFMKRQLN